jgi:hypothetical protein
LVEANKYLEFNRKIRNVDFKFIAKENKFNFRSFKNDIPMTLLKAYMAIPMLKTEKMKLLMLQLKKIEKARDDLMYLFRYFIRGNWTF